MATTKGTKQGHHKPYGPKMSNPRIRRSKERRQCGPYGYYHWCSENHVRFTTRAAYIVA